MSGECTELASGGSSTTQSQSKFLSFFGRWLFFMLDGNLLTHTRRSRPPHRQRAERGRGARESTIIPEKFHIDDVVCLLTRARLVRRPPPIES